MLKRLLFAFLALLGMTLIIVLSYAWLETTRTREQAFRDLRGVARLKVEQVIDWLQERQRDANVLQGGPELALRLQHFFASGGDPDDREILASTLLAVRENYRYDSVFLVDTRGELLVGVGKTVRVGPATAELVARAVRERRSLRSELHEEEGGDLYLDWVTPIFAAASPGAAVGAVLVLRTAPEATLLPKVGTWPTASATAVSLLARRQGDHVLVLSAARGVSHPSAPPRFPLVEGTLPAAVAVQGSAAGSMRGRDSAGKAVLAAYQPVEGTAWWLVTQVDEAEVLQPMWRNLGWLTAICGLAFLGTFAMFWRMQRQALASAKQKAADQLTAVGDNLPRGLLFQYEQPAAGSGRLNYLSAGVERLFGVTAQAARRNPELILRHLAPASLEDLRQAAARSARDLDNFASVLRFDIPHQPSLWMAVSARPQRAAAGGTIWDGLALDISDQKRAEDRLAASESRFRSLFEDTRQAIVLIEDGRFVAANQASLAMFGGERMEQLVGLTPVDISPERQPDGELSAVKAQAMIATALAEGAHRFEWMHRRANGESFPAEVLVTAIHSEGEPQLHISWRDISDEKLAEQELARYREHLERLVEARTAEANAAASALRMAGEVEQALFRVAGVGIVYVRDRVILRCNPTLERLFGYQPGEMVGQTTRGWYADDETFDAMGRMINETLLEHGRFAQDRELYRKDGSSFWGRMAVELFDRDSPEKGLVGVIADITQERQALAAMDQARQLAEEAARMKSDFVANMSHEIRTPMNAVLGFTHLALNTPLSDTQRDYLQKIKAASQLLLGIINDILDFSKIEAGKLDIEQVEFELDKLLAQVSDMLAEKISDKGLELVIDVADNVPTRLVGDALRLGQILTNYANNAFKFTAQGEIRISVALERIDQDAALIRFAVSDTGIGIAPEQLGRIFRSFEQADSSTTRKYGGTGLGLVISKRLAELMGGGVGVSSEPGRGSTFWVTVRLGIAARQPERRMPAADPQGHRLLVVDDNSAARQVLAAMLGAMGFEVAAVASGELALSALVEAEGAGRPYTLAFIDGQMPGMDGLAVIDRIARLGLRQRPRCIVVTACGRDRLPEAGRHAGVDGVLVKPLTPSRLIDGINAVLGAAGAVAAPEVEDGAPDPTVDFAGRRLLVVEDNELNQQVAVELLQDDGFEADVAENGEVALRLVQQKHYDLVLMDMQMPVMDGLQATRLLRRLPGLETLPIIAMTANAMAADREQCLAAGMNDHIAKPFEPEALRRKLQFWLGAAAGPAERQDLARLAEVCARLERHLAMADFESGELLQAEAGLLGAHLGADYAKILRAVEDFDYPLALNCLQLALVRRPPSP